MSGIRAAIQTLAEKSGNDVSPVLAAQVVSVDWDKKTCKVKTDDGREYSGVRLRAVKDNASKGLCLKPTVNSWVLVASINNKSTQRYVSMFTELDAVELVGDNDVMMIDVPNGSIEFNGGQNQGMVKVVELVEKLNAIEQDLNALKTVFSGWSPVSQDGGAALKTAAGSWFGQVLSQTTANDLKNDKVKH